MQGSGKSGSAILQEAVWAAGSANLRYMSCRQCVPMCQSHPIIQRWINSLALPLAYSFTVQIVLGLLEFNKSISHHLGPKFESEKLAFLISEL